MSSREVAPLSTRPILKIGKTPNQTYTFQDVRNVARNAVDVHLAPEAKERLTDAYAKTQKLQEQNVYGFTTGVADLSAAGAVSNALQANMVRSHAAGTGDLFDEETVRAGMFLRTANLARGYSGVRPELLEFSTEILNADIVPHVPSRGAIGAGDLAPLAHAFALVLNEGEVTYNGRPMKPRKAFANAGILPPHGLTSREGLALIAGNDMTTAVGIRATDRFEKLVENSIVSAALSMEARTATGAAFHPLSAEVKPFLGQALAAGTLKEVLKGSDQIATTYGKEDSRLIQDPPSYKTTSQTIGHAVDVLQDVKTVVLTEINSITDNPLLEDGEIPVSSGNYLNVQMAGAMDRIPPAAVTLANAAAARMQILTNPQFNEGLPPYLIPGAGENSGFMIPVYTAQGVLQEARAQSIPRSLFSSNVANAWEDVSSNAMNAALNADNVVQQAETIIAIETLIASQGIALRKEVNPDLQLGEGTEAAYTKVTEHLAASGIDLPVTRDIFIGPAIASVRDLMDEETLLEPTYQGIRNFSDMRAEQCLAENKAHIELLHLQTLMPVQKRNIDG